MEKKLASKKKKFIFTKFSTIVRKEWQFWFFFSYKIYFFFFVCKLKNSVSNSFGSNQSINFSLLFVLFSDLFKSEARLIINHSNLFRFLNANFSMHSKEKRLRASIWEEFSYRFWLEHFLKWIDKDFFF